MLKSLTHFAIVSEGEQFLLRLEVSGNEVIELAISFEQLDLLAEEIDRCLEIEVEIPLPPSIHP